MRAASITAALCVLAASASLRAGPVPKTPQFVRGADVSSITEMEKRGFGLRTDLGLDADCFRLMKEYGAEAVRLDVYVNPPGEGWCGARDTLDKAVRARMAGLEVMLAFHYSDARASSARQEIPDVWSGAGPDGLAAAVSNHTAAVLRLMKANHVVPLWVQVGNGTDDGFLWPHARISENPGRFAECFEAGCRAVKSVFPRAATVIHLDDGGESGPMRRNFAMLRDRHVTWDVAACSLFPSRTAAGRENTEKFLLDSLAVLRSVAFEFNCDTMIAEVGLECRPETYADSRRRLTALFLEAAKTRRCTGVFYYEPQMRLGAGANPLGAFDDRGFPTPVMEAFRPIFKAF